MKKPPENQITLSYARAMERIHELQLENFELRKGAKKLGEVNAQLRIVNRGLVHELRKELIHGIS